MVKMIAIIQDILQLRTKRFFSSGTTRASSYSVTFRAKLTFKWKSGGGKTCFFLPSPRSSFQVVFFYFYCVCCICCIFCMFCIFVFFVFLYLYLNFKWECGGETWLCLPSPRGIFPIWETISLLLPPSTQLLYPNHQTSQCNVQDPREGIWQTKKSGKLGNRFAAALHIALGLHWWSLPKIPVGVISPPVACCSEVILEVGKLDGNLFGGRRGWPANGTQWAG